MSELSKWANAQPSLGVLRDFMAWCEEQKMELAVPTLSGKYLMPIWETYEQLFARYLDIDTAKLERERKKLLDDHIAATKTKSATRGTAKNP